MSTPSLYATIKLAGLVQEVKNRLISRIKKPAVLGKRQRKPLAAMIATDADKTVRNLCAFGSTLRCQRVNYRTFHLGGYKRSDDTIVSSLNDLDTLHPGGFSLSDVAADDSLFLKQHVYYAANSPYTLQQAYRIFNVASALLSRLQLMRTSDGNQHAQNVALPNELKCTTFLANLQHSLRCLRQTALDAIARHVSAIIEAHVLHWQRYWQYQKRLLEGWFAEWPSGHRPLNTTWPWNVKPSLLVLWGVCWMFYGNAFNRTNNPQGTRNGRGAATIAESSGALRTRQLGPLTQPESETPHEGTSDAYANPFPDTYPNYSWLYPLQAGVGARRANATPVSQTVLPSYQANAALDSYITTTTNESSDLFATSTVQWPYCQGINPGPSPAYVPSYNAWPSTYSANNSITGTITATPPRLDPQSPVPSYAPQRQSSVIPQAAGGSGSLGLSLGMHMQNMQDYPSPHSNVSEQTTSSCFSVLPGTMMSPRRPIVPSPSMVPSLEGSTNSRQSSSRTSTEPPRNAQGALTCTHIECAKKPPLFSRKCEWTKHMDKHNRPYVCEEPECDNIRGFTYSGGLLRHQREVHRQHGGPKASCMCPHKDCKRSTGVGFSRKENLNEHLRRCHQPQADTQAEPPADIEDSSTNRNRKRRRVADGNDVDKDNGGDDGSKGRDHGDEESDLQREVKKLRRELAEKDERLRRLERMMESLTRGQGVSSG